MVSLTFKDVGQGDSILLEWLDNGQKRVGIIDCNKKDESNPVLEHLIDGGYDRIEFLVLSHPHEDHYSGFTELFEHCIQHHIPIGWFGHTAFHLDKDYWKFFEISPGPVQELGKIIRFLPELRDKSLLGKIFQISEGWQKQITTDVTIKALSPAHLEGEAYHRVVKLDSGMNVKEASQAANLLSSVLLISINQFSILLTADAVTSTLKRLNGDPELAGISYAVVQAPHHGSKKNYSAKFWKGVAIDAARKAVISSGHHDGYRHPHLQVLTKLRSLGFAIHATNIEYGMEKFVEAMRKTVVLDMVSVLDDKGGDKIFEFTDVCTVRERHPKPLKS
ncbi:ComEC/Rec2 family competence protein [Hymenobacter edaphi]|uniref:Metallo-beta-lactamase domain-containing protein n=1 Tax=Hymenobacter edaphi TaxID=2211146 RepID=A0A328B909_9BACT|nr:hypothetical protein [Hymenobacter edaphi]RAK62416.1 hypothetical protein DLM85_23730 [Hymenobacter edaphi]